MAERGWNMKVIGLKELEKIMVEDLPNTVARRTLLSAIRVSAKPMMNAAKAKVPKGGSGALAESIGLKTIRNRGFNKEFASMALAPMSGNLQAWAMYKDFYGGGEGSTASKIQSGAIDSKTAKQKRIRHGHLVEFGFRHTSGKQVPARQFLRPAFDQEANGFVNSFRAHLSVRVKNAVKKIYAKNSAALRLSK